MQHTHEKQSPDSTDKVEQLLQTCNIQANNNPRTPLTRSNNCPDLQSTIKYQSPDSTEKTKLMKLPNVSLDVSISGNSLLGHQLKPTPHRNKPW
jgi:hypothetical protein